jgi:hypothetical protein
MKMSEPAPQDWRPISLQRIFWLAEPFSCRRAVAFILRLRTPPPQMVGTDSDLDVSTHIAKSSSLSTPRDLFYLIKSDWV